MITLPWPDARLSPNSRQHWRHKHRASKTARQAAYWLTRAAGMAVPAHGPIRLSIVLYPPNSQRRDMDNAIAALKPGFDGIADAWGVDDCRFVLTFAWGAPAKPGRVEIEVMS